MKTARETIFLLILIAVSTVLIPLLIQNQIVIAQHQNNQTSSTLTNQQQPIGISFLMRKWENSCYLTKTMVYGSLLM